MNVQFGTIQEVINGLESLKGCESNDSQETIDDCISNLRTIIDNVDTIDSWRSFSTVGVVTNELMDKMWDHADKNKDLDDSFDIYLMINDKTFRFKWDCTTYESLQDFLSYMRTAYPFKMSEQEALNVLDFFNNQERYLEVNGKLPDDAITFDFNGHTVCQPLYDEVYNGIVDPVEYYGRLFTDAVFRVLARYPKTVDKQ